MSDNCPFCVTPCNQEQCPYTKEELDEAELKTKSHIQGPNHAFYSDRLRILKHLEELRAHLNKQQKESKD